MTFGDEVIVLGEHAGDDQPFDQVDGARIWVLFPAAVAMVTLAAVILLPQETAPTVVDAAGLEAPDDPTVVSLLTTSSPSGAPTPAYDTAIVDLAGTGVVTSIDHGPSGWLAIAGDVVHRSERGVHWSASTIRGLAVSDARVAVGDRVMAVMGSVHSVGNGVVGAVSTDSGDSWTLVQHHGEIAVRDVAVIDRRVFVVGSAGADEPDAPRLWEAVDGRLVQITLWPDPDVGETSVIVETGSTVAVYGTVDGAPAAWAIDGRRLPITLPQGRHTTFVDVVETGDALVALVGVAGQTGGSALWESANGVIWRERPGRPSVGGLSHLVVLADGRLAATRTNGQDPWIETPDGIGVFAFPNNAEETLVYEVDSHGGMDVWAGISEIGPTLFVAGADEAPSESIDVRLGTPRWQRDINVAIDLFARDRPLGLHGALPLPDGAMIVTSAVVFELITAGDVITVTPTFEAASAFGAGSGGSWIANGSFDGTELYLEGSGRWVTETVAVPNVWAVGEHEDAMIAVAGSRFRLQIIQRDRAGEWSLVTPLSTDLVFAMPVDGGFLASRIPENRSDVHRVMFSSDGEEWDLIDGWSFEPTPTPVLRSIDDPSVVALAADWPELQPVELPDPAASVVHAQDGIVTARTSTDLYVSDGEEKWSAVPLDVEHGITGGVIVLPGDPPRVAMFDRGRMQILTWR